jgi:hypothetical protein
MLSAMRRPGCLTSFHAFRRFAAQNANRAHRSNPRYAVDFLAYVDDTFTGASGKRAFLARVFFEIETRRKLNRRLLRETKFAKRICAACAPAAALDERPKADAAGRFLPFQTC